MGIVGDGEAWLASLTERGGAGLVLALVLAVAGAVGT